MPSDLYRKILADDKRFRSWMQSISDKKIDGKSLLYWYVHGHRNGKWTDIMKTLTESRHGWWPFLRGELSAKEIDKCRDRYLDRFELYLEGIDPVPADRIENCVASHSAHHLITWCQIANSVEHPQNLPDRQALSFVEFWRVLCLGLYPERPLQSRRRLIPPEVADKCFCFSRIPRLSCQRAPSGLRHKHRRGPFL